MTRRRLLIPTAIIVAAFSLQCASLFKKVFDAPQVGVDRVEIKKIDFTGADLIVYVKINNPNSVGATLNRIEYAFDVENERLLKGIKEDKTKIASNDVSIIPMPVSVSYAGLKSGITVILTKKALPYVLDGKVVLDTPIGDLSFNIADKGEIPIPDRPRFDVEKIALGEFSVASATLMVHIKVSNNHDVELDIEKFRYEFSLQDNLISASDVTVQKSVTQDKSMSVVLPITVKILGLKKSVVDMIRSGQLKYAMKFDLSLKTKFGPLTIPYEREGLSALY